MSVVGVIVTLAIIFSVRYGLPSGNSSANEYAANETRLISYSPLFCSGMNIDIDISLPYTTTIFSVHTEKPQLTGHDAFQFTEMPSFDFSQHDYHKWSYYLPKGSKFSFSACQDSSFDSLAHMRYYLIRGDNNFNAWVKHPTSNRAIHSDSISHMCNTGSNTSYTYTVPSDANYYMVFYLDPSGSTSGQLQIEFDVYRTKYEPVPGSSVGNCSTENYGSCSVAIPLQTTYGLLTLELDPYFVPDVWSQTSDIEVNCTARIWVYVTISLLSVAFFVLIMVVIMACCFYFVRRNKKKYSPLASQPPSATAVVPDAPAPNTAAFITKDAPPPYNPTYGGNF